MMMLILLLCVSTVIVSHGSAQKAQNCPLITESELGSTTAHSNVGVVPSALSEGDQLQPALLICDHQITCSAAGTAPETYQYLSIVVVINCIDRNFPCASSMLGGEGNITMQIDLVCTGTEWQRGTAGLLALQNTLSNTLAIPANGTLDTALDSHCALCVNNRLRESALTSAVVYSDESHCAFCDEACLNVGLGLCIEFGAGACCSFYHNEGIGFQCVIGCPANFVANASFFCIQTCTYLTNPADGQVTYSPSDSPRLVDTVASYSCDQGFNINGVNPRTCQSDGNWTGPQPSCQIATCNCLCIQDGTVQYQAATGRGDVEFDSVASYKCNNGFALTEDVERTCQLDETWSGKEPKCGLRDTNIALGISTNVFSVVVAVLIALLLIVTLVAIAMTIAAIHYYKKYQRRCTDFELVGTATQKQPPLHTALEPSACPATATPQNSGQSALADPDYDVMDDNQEQITSSEIPLALNDASTQLISSDITLAENDVYYVNAQFSSSVVPLSQNDAYNATIHNISFSDVPL